VYALEIVFSFIFSLFKTKIMKKKMVFYLIFLSLMACKKSQNCDEPSDRADVAKCLILGRWRLERTTFYSLLEARYIYMTSKDFDKQELCFLDNGTVDFFINDTLFVNSPYKFITEKDIAPTVTIDQDLLQMSKMRAQLTPFKICDDSLSLPYQSFRYDGFSDQVWAKK
jgi:hypothetical protein